MESCARKRGFKVDKMCRVHGSMGGARNDDKHGA